jgi:hypothetical protein
MLLAVFKKKENPKTKSQGQKYRDNWDIIFGKKNADNSSKIKDS